MNKCAALFKDFFLIPLVEWNIDQKGKAEFEGHFRLQQWLFTLSWVKEWGKLTKGKLKDRCSSCVKASGGLQEEKQTEERLC